MAYNCKRILLTGGGTGGSVSPLLAIADELGRDDYEYLWVGTRKGPAREMVEKEKIKFKAIASGKFRRYFSLRTLVAPLFVCIGFVQAFLIIMRFRPKWIISAGSFVSVPVVWAGWLLHRKILVHQQDVRPGLANVLMAPFAKVVTVTFEKSLEDYGDKAVWVGNPTRMQNSECRIQNAEFRMQNSECRIQNAEFRMQNFFKLKKSLSVVLVLGGGTGAMFINNLVADSLPELVKFCQIIHVAGKGKQRGKSRKDYYQYEFLSREQMAEAYERADLVVSRCGMSTLTELSYIGKPSILIPIPDSHQIDNARIFEENSAAIVLDQPVLSKEFFVKKIKEVLGDKEMQSELGENIKGVIKKGAAKKLKEIITEI